MRKVLLLFGKSNWENKVPFNDRGRQYSYEVFYTLCKQGGIQMYRASYQWYDYKKNIFRHAWTYEDNQWKRVHDIIPDIIYDKTRSHAESSYKKESIGIHYSFVNDLRFTRIIDDKFLSSLLFQEWSKRSIIVRNPIELQKNISEITTEKVVLKPINESGGKGIQIFEKENAKDISFSGEHIIQDFIDSSHGVPNMSSTMHDFRIVLVNNAIIYAYIREPKSGSFLANLAQGGSLRIIHNKDIPQSVRPIIDRAQSIFSSFQPKIYTIDIMFDKDRFPWIVELNSMPGLYFTPEERPSMEKMYHALLTVFQEKLSSL